MSKAKTARTSKSKTDAATNSTPPPAARKTSTTRTAKNSAAAKTAVAATPAAVATSNPAAKQAKPAAKPAAAATSKPAAKQAKPATKQPRPTSRAKPAAGKPAARSAARGAAAGGKPSAAKTAAPSKRSPTRAAASGRRGAAVRRPRRNGRAAASVADAGAAQTVAAEAVAPEKSAAPGAEAGGLEFQVSDGLRLHYQVWRPAGKPKRLVILVHGFADHSGRFSYLAPHLVDRGAVVYAYDQRGQGRSPGRTGHVMKFQRLVDDLDAFVQLANEREPGIPHFLYAHSTGAIAALHYLYTKPLAVDGTVLSAPCLQLTFEPPSWKSTLGKSISSVIPGFTMQAGFDPATVSRDEEVVAANKQDPLVTQKMTARFYTEVYLRAMPAALERIDQLKTPYLVLQGTEDRLVSPRVADEFEKRAADHGIVKRYEGGYHESHNDIHREEVFADVDAWIEAGAPRPKT